MSDSNRKAVSENRRSDLLNNCQREGQGSLSGYNPFDKMRGLVRRVR
jgi:hypothetical protein